MPEAYPNAEDAHTVKTYFDTRLGKPVVEQAVSIEQMEQSAPGDVLPLYDLLTAKEFPYNAHSFPKLETKDWQQEDYLNYGRWLLRILTTEERVTPLTQTHLQRMYWLGLGPERRPFLKHSGFHNMTDLKRDLEAPHIHMRSLYDDWSTGRLMDYGLQLEGLCEGKPTVDDYIQYAKEGRGPSMKQIDKRWGGITIIDEFLGYPNAESWSKDDYIQWGVRVLEANNGSIEWAVPQILAARRRGPTPKSIYKHCGPWQSFYAHIQDGYSEQLAEELRLSKERTEHYHILLAQRELPYAFRYLNDSDLLRYASRYRLAATLLPTLEEEELYALSLDTDGVEYFKNELVRQNPNITLYDIEKAATELGVTKDVLVPRYMRYLHVTSSEIEDYKKRRNEKDRERWARAKGRVALQASCA
ncbi:hypothetical protein EYC59_01495 [Candidatus Saccharibacteria bacterium]|nr:MAG: hypothetical protein EYC59_01495 [Candidatus Saccharibacteria bacterium]